MTVAAEARDLEAVREGLQHWLTARHPEADDVRVGPLGKPTSGYSSETLLVDAVRTTRGHEVEDHYVARLPPAGGGIFPTYDLHRQAEVQHALLKCRIPAAKPVTVELDERWVGAPFFLMERVRGDALAEGYVAAGRLAEAEPDVQRKVQTEFLDALADVHRVDWEGLGLGVLTPAGERGLVHDIARAEEYVAWASDGDVPSVLADSIAWLRANRPDPEPPLSLCWGDPRLGNVIYGPDFSQHALIDWEMASIGPAELDLAWFVGLHEVTAAGSGGDLPGFLGHDDVLARWAGRMGRDVVDYPWFEVMSLLRSDSIYLRIRVMLLAAGMDEPWLRGETPGQVRIASLIR
ncbi:MAG: phosphotransferase family protein [Acidimicrobiia bacterium]|jgi:aminoglycoside phosphotransferase (APT) family kinase protein